jgi:hypothetical protein
MLIEWSRKLFKNGCKDSVSGFNHEIQEPLIFAAKNHEIPDTLW